MNYYPNEIRREREDASTDKLHKIIRHMFANGIHPEDIPWMIGCTQKDVENALVHRMIYSGKMLKKQMEAALKKALKKRTESAEWKEKTDGYRKKFGAEFANALTAESNEAFEKGFREGFSEANKDLRIAFALCCLRTNSEEMLWVFTENELETARAIITIQSFRF